ncbi:MAG: SIMPL domain-containing protein [Candidatus Micrarchaeota archaeon]
MAKEKMDFAYHHNSGMLIGKLILALALLGSAYMISMGIGSYQPGDVYVSSSPAEHTIDVSSTATTEVEPDLLVVQLRVESEARTAGASQEANAEDVDAVKAAIMALGIPEKNIKTTSYGVDVKEESHYICVNTSRPYIDESGMYGAPEPAPYDSYAYEGTDCYWDYVMVGYETRHVLSVEVEALDRGGDVIDAAIKAGATEIDYISFTLKPETQKALEKSLLRQASADAKSKASEIAGGLGMSLGNAVSAGESANYYYDYPRYDNYAYAMEAGAAAPKTSVSPGQVTVSATVYASFGLN